MSGEVGRKGAAWASPPRRRCANFKEKPIVGVCYVTRQYRCVVSTAMTTRDSSLNQLPADSEPKPSAEEPDQSLSSLLSSTQESERHRASPSYHLAVSPEGFATEAKG
jgi:hypothetical protein